MKHINRVAIVLTGTAFLFFAISSLGAGHWLGVTVAFFGMLMWSLAEREVEFYKGTTRDALGIAESLIAEQKQRLDYAEGYSEQVAKARAEGWYRDTVPCICLETMLDPACPKCQGRPFKGASN